MKAVKNAVQDFWKFLQDVWWEVNPQRGRVTWPTVKGIRVSTVVVVISSVLLAGYISFCDFVLRSIFLWSRVARP